MNLYRNSLLSLAVISLLQACSDSDAPDNIITTPPEIVGTYSLSVKGAQGSAISRSSVGTEGEINHEDAIHDFVILIYDADPAAAGNDDKTPIKVIKVENSSTQGQFNVDFTQEPTDCYAVALANMPSYEDFSSISLGDLRSYVYSGALYTPGATFADHDRFVMTSDRPVQLKYIATNSDGKSVKLVSIPTITLERLAARVDVDFGELATDYRRDKNGNCVFPVYDKSTGKAISGGEFILTSLALKYVRKADEYLIQRNGDNMGFFGDETWVNNVATKSIYSPFTTAGSYENQTIAADVVYGWDFEAMAKESEPKTVISYSSETVRLGGTDCNLADNKYKGLAMQGADKFMLYNGALYNGNGGTRRIGVLNLKAGDEVTVTTTGTISSNAGNATLISSVESSEYKYSVIQDGDFYFDLVRYFVIKSISVKPAKTLGSFLTSNNIPGTSNFLLGYIHENTDKDHVTTLNIKGKCNVARHFTSSDATHVADENGYINLEADRKIRHNILRGADPLYYGIVRNTIYRMKLKFVADESNVYVRWYYDNNDDKVFEETGAKFNGFIVEGGDKPTVKD